MTAFSFQELKTIVDLDYGEIFVGFLQQTADYRRAIAAGQTGNEVVNVELQRALVGEMSHSFFNFAELIDAAIRGYTSELRFVHCEICFPIKNCIDRQLAVIVGRGRPVHFLERQFKKNDGYVWLHVATNREEMLGMLALAHNFQGSKFDYDGMARSAVLPGPDSERDENNQNRLFCSQLAMRLLAALPHPALQMNRANAQTVDDVYNICCLAELKPKVQIGHSPAQVNALVQTIEKHRPPPSPQSGTATAERRVFAV